MVFEEDGVVKLRVWSFKLNYEAGPNIGRWISWKAIETNINNIWGGEYKAKLYIECC